MSKFVELHGIDNSVFYLNISHIVYFERSYDDKETIIYPSVQDNTPRFICKEKPSEILKKIQEL